MSSRELPIDTSNPAVRDYLALIRLQVLTPLSLLINIVTVGICAFIINPPMGEISKIYPTSISPKPAMIAVYAVAIYVGQVGYCVMLVMARKEETKQAMLKGCGFALVAANWIMAIWAICWSMRLFWPAVVTIAILVLVLLYANIVLLIYHPPISSRPLDTALIHAPLRLFFVLPFMITLWHTVFVAAGLTWVPGNPSDFDKYQWEGFGVLSGVNVIGMLVVILRHDIIWCVAATWINASVWSQRPKSLPVQAVSVTFTVLYPIALVVTILYGHFRKRSHGGAIALPPDEEGGPDADVNQLNDNAEEQTNRGARRVWG